MSSLKQNFHKLLLIFIAMTLSLSCSSQCSGQWHLKQLCCGHSGGPHGVRGQLATCGPLNKRGHRNPLHVPLRVFILAFITSDSSELTDTFPLSPPFHLCSEPSSLLLPENSEHRKNLGTGVGQLGVKTLALPQITSILELEFSLAKK